MLCMWSSKYIESYLRYKNVLFIKGGTSSGDKRALPALAAKVLKNPKVQEAVIDKGLEVMNKLVDKQLRIIDEAQEKASNFLAKEVSNFEGCSDLIMMHVKSRPVVFWLGEMFIQFLIKKKG